MAETLQTAVLPRHDARKQPAVAALAALGIVYGDIGTSTLYGLKQAAEAGGAPTPETVMGIVSVILWSLILIVALKYAILILRADNHGEGGIVALLALLDARHAPRGSWRASLLIVGLIGAALLYGDGVITPAISVLSAVEGLKIDAPRLAPMVVPITIAILVGLFLVQRKGTDFIGNIFGPVMLVWFVAIGLLGLLGIMRAPGILAAISPHYAVAYLVHAGPGIAFAVLGAAFLALTGAEAMYADMGHFGRRPIQLGWFAVVLPALMLNYFGQGGLLLADPHAVENPFYLLAPRWAHYPMVAFATVATVIASQSIISGAYSLTQQAIQLGFLPRMRVLHTASHEKGQIYMPVVNWLLAVGHARGRDHVRLVRCARRRIRHRRLDADGGHHGAGGPCRPAMGLQPATGRRRKRIFPRHRTDLRRREHDKADRGRLVPAADGRRHRVPDADLASRVAACSSASAPSCASVRTSSLTGCSTRPPIRLPGAAAIFTAASTGIPLALTHHLRHNRVLHERVLLISSITTDAPRVEPEQRIKLVPVGAGITRVIFHFGFMETPDVMEGLKLACREPELHGIDPQSITYYFRRVMVIPGTASGMAVWRKSLFATMHLNANLPAAYFGVPAAQVVEVGLEVEI